MQSSSERRQRRLWERVVLVALTLTLILGSVGPIIGSARAATPLTTLSGTLIGHGSLGAVPPNIWAINGQTASARAFDTDSNIGNFLNGSPIHCSHSAFWSS